VAHHLTTAHGCVEKWLAGRGNDLSRFGSVVQGDDSWPVYEAIHDNQVCSPCVRLEVYYYPLKWPEWLVFPHKWLFRGTWKVVLALLAAMSATASAGEHDWYHSRYPKRFKCDKSEHILIDSVFFFGVTTIDANQSVGSVTGGIFVVAAGILAVLHILVPICIWDGSGRCDAKWFGVSCEVDVKLLSIHSSNNSIKYRGEFSHNCVFCKEWSISIGS